MPYALFLSFFPLFLPVPIFVCLFVLEGLRFRVEANSPNEILDQPEFL